MSGEVFVSYASKDREQVVALVQQLQTRGVSFWFDRESIDASTLWFREIVEGIDKCKVVLLAASQHCFASENVVKELSLALKRKKPILPVYLEPVEVPATMEYQLTGLQHIDWFRGDMDENLTMILRALARIGVAVEQAAPDTRATAAAPALEQVLLRLGARSFSFNRPAITAEAVRRLSEGPLSLVVLQGLVGIGKTSLLAALGRELGSEKFPHVLAVRLDGSAALEPGYLLEELNVFLTSLGRGLTPRQLTEQKPERVLETLAERLKDQSVLVLLDAVDDVDGGWLQTVLRVLSAPPRLRIAATARARPAGLVPAQIMAVPPLSDAEAVAFVAEYRRLYALDVEPEDLIARLAPGIRTHPQALATVLALLGDFPLDLLLASGTLEEASTPRRLVEQVVAALDVPVRRTLALVNILAGIDLQPALQLLPLLPPLPLLPSLQVLLSRSLVNRAASVYIVPAIVSEALDGVDRPLARAMAEEVVAAWKRELASNDLGQRDLTQLAAVGAGVAHYLSARGHHDLLHGMVSEAFLELLNTRGLWKEYSLLLRLSLEAARRADDRPACIWLGCRLTRKLIQMGDAAGARRALADVETLVAADGDTRERAELHSHRAILRQVERDVDGALRELAESRRIRTTLGDRIGLAVVEKLIGNLHLGRRDHAEARVAFEGALALLAGGPEGKHQIEVETSLALCDLADGSLDAAESRLRACRERCHALHYTAGLARILFNLALVIERQGRPAEALELAREAATQAKGTDPGVAAAARLVAARLEQQHTLFPPGDRE